MRREETIASRWMRADKETERVHRVGIGVILQAILREGLVDSTASSLWRLMAGCLIFVHEFFWAMFWWGSMGGWVVLGVVFAALSRLVFVAKFWKTNK